MGLNPGPWKALGAASSCIPSIILVFLLVTVGGLADEVTPAAVSASPPAKVSAPGASAGSHDPSSALQPDHKNASVVVATNVYPASSGKHMVNLRSEVAHESKIPGNGGPNKLPTQHPAELKAHLAPAGAIEKEAHSPVASKDGEAPSGDKASAAFFPPPPSPAISKESAVAEGSSGAGRKREEGSATATGTGTGTGPGTGNSGTVSQAGALPAAPGPVAQKQKGSTEVFPKPGGEEETRAGEKGGGRAVAADELKKKKNGKDSAAAAAEESLQAGDSSTNDKKSDDKKESKKEKKRKREEKLKKKKQKEEKEKRKKKQQEQQAPPGPDEEKEAALTQAGEGLNGTRDMAPEKMVVSDEKVIPKPSDKMQFAVGAKEVASLKKRFPKFIYVYDLGTAHTTDFLKRPLKWWNEPYAGEEFIYHILADHSVARTRDPAKADLFYVPLFVSRFLMLQRSGGMLTHDAIRSMSLMFERDVMAKVRGSHPWFNRTNGRDHFTVVAADHGRCSLLPFVSNASVYGDMFFVQYNGDHAVRSNNVDERKQMHTLSYNTNRHRAKGVPEVPCYVPSRDVVIPPFLDPSMHIVSPASSRRNFTALFRFSKYYAREEAQAVFFNHPIRIELYNLFGELQVPKWSFGSRPRKETLQDSARSVFCACPPGHAQWNARTSLAILLGCIPVTFTRHHDNAFQKSLDYSLFSVNVDPDDLPTMKRRLDKIMKKASLLKSMQSSLASAQVAFSWDPVFLNGAVSRTLDSLVARACNVSTPRPKSPLTCVKAKQERS